MTSFSAFARLQTPSDLLRKAFHDLSRMAGRMDDEYAAFDFFVTAEHLVDWHLPNKKEEQRSLRSSNVLLQVTSHLANGAKHFTATSKQHTSVQSLEHQNFDRLDPDQTGYVGNVLFVEFSPEEANLLGFRRIEAYQLALRVQAYWRERLGE